MKFKDIFLGIILAIRLKVIQRRIERFEKRLKKNKMPTRNGYYKAQIKRLKELLK